MRCSRPYAFRRRSGLWVDAPCGKCAACRVNRATEWATRLMHEMEGENKSGYFLTLTYTEAPKEIQKAELQKFMKRVRKDGVEMKYFACGEYGEKNGRPHYHVAAITTNAPAVQWDKYWTAGFVSVGTLTFQSARYTANYLLKQSDRETIDDIQKPFQLMSKGLGGAWAHDNGNTVIKGLKRGGKQQRTPRYYRKILDIKPDRPKDPWAATTNTWQRELNNNAKTDREVRRNKL